MSYNIDNTDEVEMIIIPPQTGLKDKVLTSGSADNACKKAINAAEDAISQLSVEFENWMNESIDELMEVLPLIKQNGFDSQEGEKLHTIMHDLKGQATTLGYPVVSEICDTYCNMVEKAPNKQRISPKIAELHIISIRTIVQECSKNVDDPKANAISISLRQMVMKILQSEFERSKKEKELEGV